jgi:F420-non-reducing hydrogenase small subunit
MTMSSENSRLKLAFYWCAGCGGCEESIIDLGLDLLTLSQRAQIVFWPLVIDAQENDLQAMDDDAIDLCLINGAVRTRADVEMVSLLRRKSKRIIAHGACAQSGGVIGLANLFTRADIFHHLHGNLATVAGPEPQNAGVAEGVSGFCDRVRPLDRVVAVQGTIPGCPPTPELMKQVLFDALQGRFLDDGRVAGDTKALCSTCHRAKSRSETLRIKSFKRLNEITWDPQRCFLDQEIFCAGPATRGGCDSRCIRANMPCRGCFGPPEGVLDQGMAILSFVAAIVDAQSPEAMQQVLASIPDPTGLFYRYGLADATLGATVKGENP